MNLGLSINEQVLSLQFTKDGLVSAQEIGGETIELGTIELAKFVNPGGLQALGDNLYAETEASGIPILGQPGHDGFGEITARIS